MNGLKQTRSLAMMMLQTGDENFEEQYKIKRLTTAELKDKDLPKALDLNIKALKNLLCQEKKPCDQLYHHQSLLKQ